MKEPTGSSVPQVPGGEAPVPRGGRWGSEEERGAEEERGSEDAAGRHRAPATASIRGARRCSNVPEDDLKNPQGFCITQSSSSARREEACRRWWLMWNNKWGAAVTAGNRGTGVPGNGSVPGVPGQQEEAGRCWGSTDAGGSALLGAQPCFPELLLIPPRSPKWMWWGLGPHGTRRGETGFRHGAAAPNRDPCLHHGHREAAPNAGGTEVPSCTTVLPLCCSPPDSTTAKKCAQWDGSGESGGGDGP